MNGTEQRLHRTATQALDARLGYVETITAAGFPALRRDADERFKHVWEVVREHERRLDHIGPFCDERWEASCQTAKRIIDRHDAFVTRTFWQRLRWLVTGQ